MVTPLNPSLTPRNGVALQVLLVCRISTVHQDPRSLKDQEASLCRYVSDHYAGSVEFKVIASQGSGEILDRRELIDVEERIESRAYDLVLVEDLARLCRRVHAYAICELCQDSDTRLIALNDQVDTRASDWQRNAWFSIFKHESSNEDTSRRIRRSLRNRFLQGGVIQFVVYGHLKPPGATSDAEIHKDPAAEPIYDEWFRRLEDGASYAEVSDWLNDQEISPGPFCRSTRWTGKLVAQVTHNPILKGIRVRNRKISKRWNRTGRRRSVAAPPEEFLERPCPHLAFIDPVRYDRVLALLAARNAKCRRGRGGPDPRQGVSRRRTRWPGQHATCGICGRLFRYGGHGQADSLLCGGATDYKCWNAVSFAGPAAARRLSRAILNEIAALPGYDEQLQQLLTEEVARRQSRQADRRVEVARGLARNERAQTNLVAALRETGPSPALVAELQVAELEGKQLRGELATLDGLPRQVQSLPPLSELKTRLLQSMEGLAIASPPYGRLMAVLIHRLEIWPYRLCDGGRSVCRAHLGLDLTALVPEARGLEATTAVLRRELVVDLFDPVQRVAYRQQVLAGKARGLTERQIAAELGITQPAVQKAAALSRQMDRLGLTDPYVRLEEPPADDTKWRRHRHPRYQFSTEFQAAP